MSSRRDDETSGLLARAKAGDRAALDGLAGKLLPDLFIWIEFNAGKHVLRELTADDLFNETWYRAQKSLGRFENRGRGAFKAWAVDIARCLIYDVNKKIAAGVRGKENLTSFHTNHADITSGEPGVATKADAREKLARLHKILSELPEYPRQVFMMVRFEGLTRPEVAQKLGIPRSTVYDRYNAACISIERIWRQRHPEDFDGSSDH